MEIGLMKVRMMRDKVLVLRKNQKLQDNEWYDGMHIHPAKLKE